MKYALPRGFVLPEAGFVLKKDLETNPFRALQVLPGDVVLDVGSYVGTFAVSALEAGAARVVCFEPFAEARLVLAKNLKPYGAKRAMIDGRAVSSTTGYAKLEIAGLAGNQSIVGGRYAKCKSVAVRTVSIRTVLRNWKPQVLKLDVEEAEYDILLASDLGVDELRTVREVFIEFHRAKQHVREMSRIAVLLRDAGFVMVQKAAREQTWRRGRLGLLAHVNTQERTV